MAKKTAKAKKSKKITPLMQQYARMKAKHPSAILLFRVGDFYETFGQDAITAAATLGIVLTSRNNGGSDIELAGFPHHSLETYLPRLIRAGYRVAICEQLEKPSKDKKIVKRGVTEVVTPGVVVNDQLLEGKKNNYLAAIAFGRKREFGISFLDISTGEFVVSEGNKDYIDKLLQSFKPSEVIFSRSKESEFKQLFGNSFYTSPLEEWAVTPDYTQEKLLSHFEVAGLKGFGVGDMALAQQAAGMTLHYLATTENNKLQHITSLSRLQPERYVWLDRFTIRNLELVYPNNPGGKTLLDVMDQTISPMGARLMRKWIVLPLCESEPINERHDTVDALIADPELRTIIGNHLQSIGDLERLVSKIPMGKINPREIVQLRIAQQEITPLKNVLTDLTCKPLQSLGKALDGCQTLVDMIAERIGEDPPVNLSKGGVLADGFHPELDDLRNIVKNSKELLLGIQTRETERTGINSLKIGFNNVFGYYLEVTHKYKDQVPPEWVRKQTLTSAERYITDELKTLESKILGAEEKILQLEEKLYEELVIELADYISPIQRNASHLARLDCLMSFAKTAIKQRYVRPELNDGHEIDIRGGRHPVIEQQLDVDDSYVPNDVFLDGDSQQILMITGPNMSGKSALLRQTALIVLMAQMGSYVPADQARLAIVDRIFTRVGASDNISSGESTFMVEMNETASILNNLSDRSLILLDEIGRGTSTYDGISIAWAIAEYLHNHPESRAKTLFATHYHELNELAQKLPRIKNYHVSTREVGQRILFLRKLKPGGSQHSFGIHVARLAGMPRSLLERANELLHQLEQKSVENGGTSEIQVKAPDTRTISAETMQLSIFETVDPVAGQLRTMLQNTDLNATTPVECMLLIKEMQDLLKEEG